MLGWKRLAISICNAGLNQLVAMRRAGYADAHMAGVVGRDGDWILHKLISMDIATDRIVKSDDHFTGHANIYQQPADVAVERGSTTSGCVVLWPGANDAITREHIEGWLSGTYAGLVLQNEVGGTEEIISLAHDLGIRVIFNSAPRHVQNLCFWNNLPVEVLVVSREEAADLIALFKLDGHLDHEQTVRGIHSVTKVQLIICTLDKDGLCYLKDGADYAHLPVHPCLNPVIDTTGAGDCFVGYFASEYFNGSELQRCFDIARAAAAICVERRGTSTAIPTLDNVLARL